MAKPETIGSYETCFLYILAPATQDCPRKARWAFAFVTLASLGMFIAGALGFSGTLALSRDANAWLFMLGGSIFMAAVIIHLVVMTIVCVGVCVGPILVQRSYANLIKDFHSR